MDEATMRNKMPVKCCTPFTQIQQIQKKIQLTRKTTLNIDSLIPHWKNK